MNISKEWETRAARPEEADETLQILCDAFGLPYDTARPIFYADPFFDLSHKRLLRSEKEGIRCCLTVIPTTIRVGAAWVPLAGIAGVATHTHHQGRGYATHLLRDTVSHLNNELGYSLSGLFACTEQIYRRLGWETANVPVRQTICRDALPPSLDLAPIHFCSRTQDSFSSAIRSLHQKEAEQRTGGCLRDPRRWHLIDQAPGRQCAVLQRPGKDISGYIFWEQRGKKVHVLELTANQPSDYQQMLAFAASQAEGAILEWSASPMAWQSAGLSAQEAPELSADPKMMLRLVNLQEALSLIHRPNLLSHLLLGNRSLTVRATDQVRPENNIPIRLTVSGVTPGHWKDKEWIAADIGALAPIYFGYRTPSEAEALGVLQASSPSVLALADQLFPRRTPFVSPLDQF